MTLSPDTFLFQKDSFWGKVGVIEYTASCRVHKWGVCRFGEVSLSRLFVNKWGINLESALCLVGSHWDLKAPREYQAMGD